MKTKSACFPAILVFLVPCHIVNTAVATAEPNKPSIALFAPADGGTPRDPTRIEAGPGTATTDETAVTVARWQMHEFELHGRCRADNPFRDAALVGEFTSPSGRKIAAEGFYDGGDTWRLRFTPDEQGRWLYLLRGEGVELLTRGSLDCVAPTSRNETNHFVFPTAEPERLGMDAAKLREARDYALKGGGSGSILRGGRLVMAWGDQKCRYDIYSSTKSIGITALGLAVMDGKVRLHDKAGVHLPGVGVPPESNAQSGWLEELTLWHLATQTGGFEKTRGWCRQLQRPGAAWMYSDGGPNWLADCLTMAYGRDLLEVMNERVFGPLGITVGDTVRGGEHDLHWGFNNLDRAHQVNGINRRPFGAGIHCNVEAMARIGYLYLRLGRWQGRQIIPEDFVAEAATTASGIVSLPAADGLDWTAGAPQHYGLLWWNNNDGAMPGVPRDAFWAQGMKESILAVIPSLDIVAVRAGDYLAPANDPRRSDTYNNIIKPFLLPICQSVSRGAPYPPSAIITSIAWTPQDSIVCPARKADNWPITWADDGQQYTAFGDGWGFVDEYPPAGKLSLGFCRIVGDPPDVTGVNIPSDGEQKGGGARGRKASGLLCVDGVLYMWVRNVGQGNGEQSQLAWSTDRARTWHWANWRFEEFGYPCFLNFGKDYAGARDGYVYTYSPDTPSAYYETDEVILMRVPKERIQDRAAYEFFAGLNEAGDSVWTSDIRGRHAVFRFPGGCNRMDVTYNVGLRRYLMVMRSRPNMSSDAHLPDKTSKHGINQFSIYDAPQPWGPWTTVYYTEQWEGTPLSDLKYWQGWGESAHLPAKWMSADGKTVQMLFAGGPGGFSIRRADLTVRGTDGEPARAEARKSHGFIRIHPENPYAFAYADGTPFFPMGDTCYGLYSDSPITPALRTQYLKTRRAQRFNFVRLGVIHSPTHGQTNPNFWPWGGTPGKPDLDRFNPQFFRGLDAVLTEMQALGMNAELIVLNYYLTPFTDVKAWTLQRQREWLRYVTARYAAFPNLFLWTIVNEYETHPDGRYRLDVPDDPDWAKATARFIKQHDPYRHLVTTHPVVSATTRGRSPNDPFDPPWRIGEFFGKDDAMDVLSQQTGQSGEGVVWDQQLQCWRGDAPDLVASLRSDRRYQRPVLNTESGYEYLRGHPTEKKQVHHTDKVRHSAWRIVCGGGYFAAGFHGTIGHSDFWNRIDAPNHYTFTIKDEGAAEQLGFLYDFFMSLPFWRMQPFEGVTPDTAVALADPGRIYVIYLPDGGEVTIDLSAASGSFAVEWFNPRSGDVIPGESTSGGAKQSFKPPFGGDAVLCIPKRSS